MRWRSLRLGQAIAVLVVAWTIAGCGGGTGSNLVAPITVSLGISPVVVPLSGTPTRVQITIDSTSETALVSFTGLPSGVQVKYAASDTNPSGLLTFVANPSATAGTYMPNVTVNSAGQTVTLKFTLIVAAG